MLAPWHVSTLPNLLRRLDRLAPAMARNEDPLDPHIASFMANRLPSSMKSGCTQTGGNAGVGG